MLVETVNDEDPDESREDPYRDWEERYERKRRRDTAMAIAAILLSLLSLAVSILNTTVWKDAAYPRTAEAQTSVTTEPPKKADAGKKKEKAVVYDVKPGSRVEGDYEGMHVRLTGLRTVGDKATLTAELTNNGSASAAKVFVTTAFQNGLQADKTALGTDGALQPGYTATVTADITLKDPSKPVSLETDLYTSGTLRTEFDPKD